MSPAALQDRSQRLAGLVDELGAALQGSGIDSDTASRLLASASTAVLNALTLDLLLDADPPVSPPAETVPAEEPATVEPVLPRAA